jgi:phospholipid/cholesterol/gamma-HCH transport system substrate-binding protein
MLKYRAHKLIRAGFIGIVLILLIIAVGLQPTRLVAWASSIRYYAVFAEAGGLSTGNDVTMAGMKVGSVSGMALKNGDIEVAFSLDERISLGSQTTAHIRTGTLLGEKVLTLGSDGTGKMRPNDVIPVTRTSSPYSLTEAVDDLTSNVAATDTAALNESLNTLSAMLDQIAPQLGPAFDGLTRVSKAVNERDDTLGELLKYGSNVATVLGERSQQVNTLILNANDLVAVLAARRQAIVGLLANTSAVAQQLSGLVHDNEQQLAPTLDKMNAVIAMLEENRDNISKTLPGLAKYESTLGEVVASGPFYTALIPNLDLPEVVQPFFDYAFGFRRGTSAGQPPDNAGPRAEIPFPYNGIPLPGEQWPR